MKITILIAFLTLFSVLHTAFKDSFYSFARLQLSWIRFSRFEEATAVTMDEAARFGKARPLLDIATATPGRTHAQLLTTGLSQGEAKQEAAYQMAPPTP